MGFPEGFPFGIPDEPRPEPPGPTPGPEPHDPPGPESGHEHGRGTWRHKDPRNQSAGIHGPEIDHEERHQHMKDMAYLSGAAYGMEKGIDFSQVPGGYGLDTEFSGPDRSVFTKGDKAYVAFRGTDPLNIADLGTDVMIALGMERNTRRFAASLDVTRKVIDKYGLENVELTGHSLGGTQAMYVNDQTGAKASVFNPGAFVFQAVEGYVDRLFGHGSNATIYSTTLDPISLLSYFENAEYVHVKPKHAMVHALTNFV